MVTMSVRMTAEKLFFYFRSRASAEKFPGGEATKKRTKNSKKRTKISTIMPLLGGGGQRKKRPENNKKRPKNSTI